MTRVILIRHGITEWNRRARYCGSRDIGLSKEGRRQARKLGVRLRAAEFDEVYCSDRRRAMQTGRIIFGRRKMVKMRGLREIDFGMFEGLRHNELMKKHPGMYGRWLKDPYRHPIPKAEPVKRFKARIERAVRRIVRSNPGKEVAVVCHGGVIGILVSAIRKERDLWRYIPSAASITVVEYQESEAPRAKARGFHSSGANPAPSIPVLKGGALGRRGKVVIRKFNDTAHLEVRDE